MVRTPERAHIHVHLPHTALATLHTREAHKRWSPWGTTQERGPHRPWHQNPGVLGREFQLSLWVPGSWSRVRYWCAQVPSGHALLALQLLAMPRHAVHNSPGSGSKGSSEEDRPQVQLTCDYQTVLSMGVISRHSLQLALKWGLSRETQDKGKRRQLMNPSFSRD